MSKRWTRGSARTTTTVLIEAPDVQKARRLPMFGPGIAIKIPLHLLPAYMELYGLEPVEDWRAPVWKPAALLVKRNKKKETHAPADLLSKSSADVEGR